MTRDPAAIIRSIRYHRTHRVKRPCVVCQQRTEHKERYHNGYVYVCSWRENAACFGTWVRGLK